MTSDPKGRTEPGYRRHAFVCGHERQSEAARPSCLPKGSLDLMRELKQAVKRQGLSDIRVQKSGCLDYCEYGPTCVVYPEGTWYALKDQDALDAVLEHLLNGTVDETHTLRMT